MNPIRKKLSIAALAVCMTAICAILGFLLGHPRMETTETPSETSTTQLQIRSLPKGKKIEVPAAIYSTKLYLKSDLNADTTLDPLMQQIVQTGFNSVVFADSRQSPQFSTAVDCPDALRSAVAAARKNGLYCAVYVQSGDPAADAAWLNESGADCAILPNADAVAELDMRLAPTAVGCLLVRQDFNDATALPTGENVRVGVCTTLPDNASGDSIYARKSAAASSETPLWFDVRASADKTQKGFEKLSDGFTQLSAILQSDGASSGTSFVFCPFTDFADDAECLRIVKAALTSKTDPSSFRKMLQVTNHKQTSFSTNESKVTFIGECSPMYPLTCNNVPIAVTSDGFFSQEFDLQNGKNTFTFTQQNKTVTYNVQYQMDLIRSISPSGTLTTPGGSVLEISVVAHRKAGVYATLNGSRITLTGSDALLADTDSDRLDVSSDYVTYTGKYNLPESSAKSLSLGSIRAFASYNGASDSITGASVQVTAAEKVGALPVVETPKTTTTTQKMTTTTTTATVATTTTAAVSESESEPENDSENASGNKPTSSTNPSGDTTSTTKEVTTASTSSSTVKQKLDPVITPYQNHGIAGTKRMCVIKTYYTETMPLSPLNDLSVPLTTPLLQGTFDFITGESSFDKYTYYNLGSGRRVYRKDVEVIEKAYAMPANTIDLVSSGTSSGSTDVNLHVKWKVPFNIVLNGQKYVNDPKNKREYAVTALNASSLDITFYYTADASGQPNVSGSGVISSCEWVQSASAQTYTLRLHLKNASKFYGYSFSYNADDTLCIRIKERSGASVSGKTVMLDPGHGGKDGGANCAVNATDYNEAKIVLSISEKVRSKLQAMGANVLMTRTTNTDVSLDARKKMARQQRPDVFVSIHCDAAESSSAYGTTGYYYRNYSQSLAKSIHTHLVNTYAGTLYGSQKSGIDRGTVFYPFSVTRIEECPSVLIEVGYVSNMTECKILQNVANQDALASAIANGIRDYFAQN